MYKSYESRCHQYANVNACQHAAKTASLYASRIASSYKNNPDKYIYSYNVHYTLEYKLQYYQCGIRFFPET